MPEKDDNLLHFQYNGLDALSVLAHFEYFPRLESWIDEICDKMDLDTKIRAQLQIVADEIFTNICSYAYPEPHNDANISVACSFDRKERTLELIFSDHGIEFNPLKTQCSPKPRKPQNGGVGLLMVRKIADSLKYERRDNHNVLSFLKKI